MGKATQSPFSFGPHFDAATGKRPYCVGIRCKCGREDHRAAPGVGWGRRIFKELGWQVADRMGRHECPSCVSVRKSGRHVEVEPVSPVVVAQPEVAQEEVVMENTVMAEKLGDAMLNRFQLAAKATTGRRGATEGFRHKHQAKSAAEKAARRAGFRNPERDTHYELDQASDGSWGYALLNEPRGGLVPPAVVAADKVTYERRIAKGVYTPKGTPPVVRPYAIRAAAVKAAKKYLQRCGVGEPKEGQHYVTSTRGNAKGWWVSILDPKGIPAGGFPPPFESSRFADHSTKATRSPDGRIFSGRWNAARSARTYLDRKGVENPREGVHFNTVPKGDEWTVKILDPRGRAEPLPAAPAPDSTGNQPMATLTKNWGYLSSFDAKKAAFGHFDRQGRTSGAPVEGRDYWLIQDARNLWGYSLTDPNPKPEPVPEPVTIVEVPKDSILAELVKETAPVSDASTQAVRDLEESRLPPISEVRQPTVADNRRVRVAVEDHYDEDRQMYRGNWSDRMLAEELKVPRAWVTRAREMYGPDVNNDAEIRRQAAQVQARIRIEEAIKKCEEAIKVSNTILELAAGLEGILADLKAKRLEIG